MLNQGRPEFGKQYRIFGNPGEPSILNGNSWAESEQRKVHRLIDEQRSSGKEPRLRPEVIKIADSNGFEIFTTGRLIPAY